MSTIDMYTVTSTTGPLADTTVTTYSGLLTMMNQLALVTIGAYAGTFRGQFTFRYQNISYRLATGDGAPRLTHGVYTDVGKKAVIAHLSSLLPLSVGQRWRENWTEQTVQDLPTNSVIY